MRVRVRIRFYVRENRIRTLTPNYFSLKRRPGAVPGRGSAGGRSRNRRGPGPRSVAAWRSSRARGWRTRPRFSACSGMSEGAARCSERLGEDEAHVGVAVVARHRVQHARRGRRLGVVERRARPPAPRRGRRCRRSAASSCRGDRLACGEDSRAPFGERDLARRRARAAGRARGRARATRCWLRVIAAISCGVSGGLSREQAMQQEDVEEAAGRRGDADRRERIEVHQAHLDVLDAALAQRVQRALAGLDARASGGSCRRTRSRSAAAWSRAGGSRRPSRMPIFSYGG